MLSKADFMILQSIIKGNIPSFEVAYKDRSDLMFVLGFLVTPFNPDFMTGYTTTWGTKVYFPSENFLFDNPARGFRILAHEYVHLLDAKNHKTFKLSYLFPQILMILPLIAYAILAWPYSWIAILPFFSYILACVLHHLGGATHSTKPSRSLFWVVLIILLGITATAAWLLTGWTALVLLSVILFLFPWPAPWRTKWELRGYGMDVAITQWLSGVFSEEHREAIIKQFVGPTYLCMSWSRSKVSSGLDIFRDRAASGELQKEQPYSLVFKLLDKD